MRPRAAAWVLAADALRRSGTPGAAVDAGARADALAAGDAGARTDALAAGDAGARADASPSTGRPCPGTAPDLLPGSGRLFREGAHWRLEGLSATVLLADRVGVGYLAQLLAAPGRTVTALALTGSADWVEPTGQAVLDPAAREAYRMRLADLDAELDEAGRGHDLVGVERLRDERDALLVELAQAAGLGGRTREFGASAERARTAVRKALVRVIDEVAAADPALGAHLRASVRTGSACGYAPDPAATISWQVRTT